MLQALVLLGLILAQQSPAAETVRYIHTDALGSVVAVTDASGAVIERREYEPYGAQLMPAVADGPGYTGHVQDAATGLTYMQQRYYDPLVGVFLSVDPVTAYSNPVGQFNRYRYANNNPYRFTDPDGRLSRGEGWTDRQWRQFDRAQQSAAKGLERAAANIDKALDGGKGMRGLARAFERNFGSGSATPENMAKAASDMSSMAAALRDTGSDAIPANLVSSGELSASFSNFTADTFMGVPRGSGVSLQVVVNKDHSLFGNRSMTSWSAGHETAHAVLNYRDQSINNIGAYKFGLPSQQEVFNSLPPELRLINPDHLMDFSR
ncbi:RHS repeat domain-containing protein [Luteimonas salinisoli]|nr:RHS repeat-associated core domain-containing protein [Luteimonas salinisoli]